MTPVKEQRLTPAEHVRWTRVGMLAAIALLLSYAETFVPIPIPGVKLGLANIAVLVALFWKDVSGAVSVACVKVLAAGFLFGSPLTMAYSIVGTLFSLAGMIVLSRLRTMRLEMVSVAGALLHEAGQLVVASVILGTGVVWYASPVLLVAGCITGTLCGVLAKQVVDAIPADAHDECAEKDEDRLVTDVTSASHAPTRPSGASMAGFLALIGFTVVVLHLTSLTMLTACAMAATIACVVAHVRLRTFAHALGPLACIAAFTFVMQLLVAPQVAFEETVRAILRLACVTMASLAFARLVPAGDLTGTVAWLAQPLEHLGFRTQGFVHAFDVAITLIPTLVAIVREEFGAYEGRLGIGMLKKLLPKIVRRLYAEANEFES